MSRTMTRRQAEQRRFFRQQRRAAEKALDRQITATIRTLVTDLWKHMDEVEDYRTRECTYSLDLLLILIFIGYMMGENDISNIANVIHDNSGKIRSWLGIKYVDLKTMPSYAELLRALHGCDTFDLAAVLVEWIERNFYIEDGILHVAVDGKALRGATRKIRGHVHPKFILNAFNVSAGCISMQLEVGDKTNELGSMPELFSAMHLENVTITIDAAGTNGKIMSIIVANHGHVVLPVKGNQANLEASLSDFIEKVQAEHPEWIFSFDDIDNDVYHHGRIENRHYILIFEGVADILKGTAFENLAHSVGMVTRTVTQVKRDEDGNQIPVEPSVETQIYISDYRINELSAEQFAHFVRNHWRGCETQHYILDVEFDEDKSRLHKNAKTNASFFRKAALSLINNLKKISHTNKSCHAIRSTFRSTFGFSGSQCPQSQDTESRNTA